MSDPIAQRLITCFTAVFPTQATSDLLAATTDSLAAWDSIANVTLIGVIEEEFNIAIDIDELSALDSFAAIRSMLAERQATN